MTKPDFDRKTRKELARWYVKNVGYDPTLEDPKTPTKQLLRDCKEMHGYFTCKVDGKGRKKGEPDFDPTV